LNFDLRQNTTTKLVQVFCVMPFFNIVWSIWLYVIGGFISMTIVEHRKNKFKLYRDHFARLRGLLTFGVDS